MKPLRREVPDFAHIGVQGGLNVTQADPSPTHPCIRDAHGVQNNLSTRAPNRPGAYGVPETPGTAAIDRAQFLPSGSSDWSGERKNAYINQYRSQISGYATNGTLLLHGVSGNINASGVRVLTFAWPSRVLFELPGGAQYGNINGMRFEVPNGMPCPHQ